MATRDEEIEKKIKELEQKNKELEDEIIKIGTDEYLQENMDKLAVKRGISSKIYKGRHISIIQHEGATIQIIHNNYHHFTSVKEIGQKYEPVQFNLSLETFVLILEAMEFAEKKFQIDRNEVIKVLTEGKNKGDLEFEDKIIFAHYS